ncbi:DUF6207 family protein [Streptomyces sp. NPDC048650]|uniref:DUF6207 family protein n=1 Tax=Streptomyces sp. NPDC048650 TaxID=3365583 RepID=UPI0037191DE8
MKSFPEHFCEPGLLVIDITASDEETATHPPSRIVIVRSCLPGSACSVLSVRSCLSGICAPGCGPLTRQ